VKTVEGTVAQHHEDIPLLQLGTELLDDPVGRGLMERGLARTLQLGNQAVCIKAFAGGEFGGTVHLADDDAMRSSQGLRKFLLENGATLDSSVMKKAIHGNKPSMIKYLHTLGTPMPEFPLLSALSNKHYGLVKTLVNCGANRDEPLGPVTTILEGFLDDDSAVLALCQAGANVNVSSNGTPLICAAVSLLRRNLDSLKTLCKYKVNLNVQDTDGSTPLHILVDDAKPGDDGDLAFIKVLLKNPIDFSLVDNFGETALDIAIANGDKAIICEIKKAMLRQKMK
jgi:ankyrin repeat protein